ncbi:hypothetical protein AA313_de0208046 [Arthrobotrys entomopaga]|nr:hypothetical protein AA313_de0208046 [Arthrobotrys entomopaga]
MAIHPSSVQIPASNDIDDDYYDESAPQPESITRLASKHTTEGYRDGITASKQQHIQEGFDEGYILGAALGLKIGELLGILDGIVGTINGLLVSLESSSDSEDIEQLKELLERHAKVRETARQELSLEKVFGREYFGEDGVWKWTTAEDDEAGDEAGKTFDDIVLQHPLVVKWSDIVRSHSEELGLHIRDDTETDENGSEKNEG